MTISKLFAGILLVTSTLLSCGNAKSDPTGGKSGNLESVNEECLPIDSLDMTSWESVDSIVVGSAVFDVVLRTDSAVIKFNDWIMEEPTGLVKPNEKGYETVMSVKKYYEPIDSQIKKVLDRPHRQFIRNGLQESFNIAQSLYESFADSSANVQSLSENITYHTRLANVLTERLTAQETDSVRDLLEYIIRSKDVIIDSISEIHHGWNVDYFTDDWWTDSRFRQPDPKYVYQCSVFVADKCYVTGQWPYYKKRSADVDNYVNNFTPAFERLRLLLNRIRNKYAPDDYLKFDPEDWMNFEID